MISRDSTQRTTKQQELFSIDQMGYFIQTDHLLYKLKEIYDFDRWYPMLKRSLPPKSRAGRKPRDIVMKAKMLLLGFFDCLSDREVEAHMNVNIMYRYFCDLPAYERAPDHTQLSKLRKKIRGYKIHKLFDDVVTYARERGLVTDNWSSTDSTHLEAKVSPSRKSIRNEKYMISNEQKNPKAWRKESPKPPTDRDARWGAKSKDTIFYGYKMHAAIDSESEILTKVYTTPGQVFDGHYLGAILETRAKNITGDCHYKTKVNDFILRDHGIRNWIFEKGKRKHSKWIGNIRRVIERKFGEAKNWHSLFRCRYWGLMNVKVHCFMIAIAMNLKRLVALT